MCLCMHMCAYVFYTRKISVIFKKKTWALPLQEKENKHLVILKQINCFIAPSR